MPGTRGQRRAPHTMLGAATGPPAPWKCHTDEPWPEWQWAAPLPPPRLCRAWHHTSGEARGWGRCTKTQRCSEPQGTMVGPGSLGSVHPDPPIPSGKGPPSEGKPPCHPGDPVQSCPLCTSTAPPGPAPSLGRGLPGGGSVPWETAERHLSQHHRWGAKPFHPPSRQGGKGLGVGSPLPSSSAHSSSRTGC